MAFRPRRSPCFACHLPSVPRQYAPAHGRHQLPELPCRHEHEWLDWPVELPAYAVGLCRSRIRRPCSNSHTVTCLVGPTANVPACPAGQFSQAGASCQSTQTHAGNHMMSHPQPSLTLPRYAIQCHLQSLDCEANTYSTGGAAQCTACPDGATSAAGASTCVCKAGYTTSGSGGSLVCTSTQRALVGQASRRIARAHRGADST